MHGRIGVTPAHATQDKCQKEHETMRCRSILITLSLLLCAAASHGQQRVLEPVKQIGVSKPPNKWGWMSFVAFSSDGKQVASDGYFEPEERSGNLSFWTFPEGKLIRKLPINITALSPDWKYYATYHEVSQIDAAKPLLSFKEDDFHTFAFSPDSRFVAMTTSKDKRGPRIRILELPSGKQLQAFGKRYADSFAFNPDNTILAAEYWNLVTLWNTKTGERIGIFEGFGRYVQSIAFSPDGAYLAAGTDTGDLQIWDVHRQARVLSLHQDGGYVSTPAFSPDGRLIAFGIYGTGTVWLVDRNSGQILDKQKISDLGCGSAAFSPDSKFLITPSTGGLVKWPYDTGGTIRVFRVNLP